MGVGNVTRHQRFLLLSGALVALGTVVALAVQRRTGPSRCDSGWVNVGARCCAPGQSIAGGHCAGTPSQCPPGFHRALSRMAGCVFDARRIQIGPTTLKAGPNDWQSEQVPPIDRQVGALLVDATEVDGERWQACAVAHRCVPKPIVEPGQPVTNLSVDEARSFCAAAGGRLPTLDERMAVAVGNESRRYPWGQTGLVCRRAVFGVTSGPCAEKGSEPDLAGSHPDGKSPEGLLDLSGNVAELAVDDQQRAWACGGSFRSKTALELKSWACSLFLAPADDVGLRCVYDLSVQ
jgi:formylglycine-generating enzyme